MADKIKISQAALKGTNGVVYPCGPMHDISVLPTEIEVAEEGFLTSNGDFLNRDQAAKELHTDHPVHSEELNDLVKKEGGNYTISPPQKISDKLHEIKLLHQNKPVGHLRFYSTPVNTPGHKHFGYHRIETAEVGALHRGRGLYGKMLNNAASYVKGTLKSKGLLSEGHWRSEAATGAWNRLAAKNKKVQKLPGLEPDTPDFRLNEKQNLDLIKYQPTTTFPKLGLNDNRRETPILISPKEINTRNGLLRNALSLKYNKKVPQSINERISVLTNAKNGAKPVSGRTGPGGPVNTSYAKDRVTKLHEDAHMMFNRVNNKYGPKAALNLTQNLYNHIPEDSRNALNQYVKHKYGGAKPPDTKYYEEHLAHLVSYLNNPNERKNFHSKQPGHWDPINNHLTDKGIEYQTKMKQGYRALQGASKIANKNWLKKIVPVKNLNKTEWFPSLEEIAFAQNFFNEEIELNQDLIKNDMDVSVIPRIVKPFNLSAQETAKRIQRAFDSNSVHTIQLKGKHIKGSALARDPETEIVYLLKPGYGNLSPAQGVREESASQSRREVAFPKMAAVMGLGYFFVKAELIYLDGMEVAALEFLPSNFKGLDKWKKDPNVNLSLIFNNFLKNAILYKWATIDYLLGQPDRHAGNIMMDNAFNVKLIDHGSAFAGIAFDPAGDSKSFVPYYLRVFSPRKFTMLTPSERLKTLPFLSKFDDDLLKYWLDDLSEGKILNLYNEYGINSEPFIERLKIIRNWPGPKYDFLNKFYSDALNGVDNANRNETY